MWHRTPSTRPVLLFVADSGTCPVSQVACCWVWDGAGSRACLPPFVLLAGCLLPWRLWAPVSKNVLLPSQALLLLVSPFRPDSCHPQVPLLADANLVSAVGTFATHIAYCPQARLRAYEAFAFWCYQLRPAAHLSTPLGRASNIAQNATVDDVRNAARILPLLRIIDSCISITCRRHIMDAIGTKKMNQYIIRTRPRIPPLPQKTDREWKSTFVRQAQYVLE